jgi:hypothetical protein
VSKIIALRDATATTVITTLRKAGPFLALFVVAYCGFLAYFYAPTLIRGTGEIAAKEPLQEQEQKPKATDRVKEVVPLSTSAAALANAEMPTAISMPDREIPTEESRQLTSEATQEMNYLSGRAPGPVVNSERSTALRKLRNGANTPEAVQALSMTIVSDQAVGNRLLAVTALRNLSKQGDDDGAIRSALQQAMGDSDAKVAQFARAAYDEVTSRYAPRS